MAIARMTIITPSRGKSNNRFCYRARIRLYHFHYILIIIREYVGGKLASLRARLPIIDVIIKNRDEVMSQKVGGGLIIFSSFSFGVIAREQCYSNFIRSSRLRTNFRSVNPIPDCLRSTITNSRSTCDNSIGTVRARLQYRSQNFSIDNRSVVRE